MSDLLLAERPSRVMIARDAGEMPPARPASIAPPPSIAQLASASMAIDPDDLYERMQALVRDLALSARSSWREGERATRERAWGTAAVRALAQMRMRFAEIDDPSHAMRTAARPTAEFRECQPWLALLEATGH